MPAFRVGQLCVFVELPRSETLEPRQLDSPNDLEPGKRQGHLMDSQTQSDNLIDAFT